MALITLTSPITSTPAGYRLVVDVECSDASRFACIGGWSTVSISGGVATLVFDLGPNDPDNDLSEGDYLAAQRNEVRLLIEYALAPSPPEEVPPQAGRAGEAL